MLLVPSLLAMKTTIVIITMVSMAMVGAIIVVSVVVVTLVEATAMAVEVSEVAMGRRNPLTTTPTSTVDTVREWVMIFMSAGSMLRSKKERRIMEQAPKVEATRLLVRQNNINQVSFALIKCPLM
jgi:hypothetical protein